MNSSVNPACESADHTIGANYIQQLRAHVNNDINDIAKLAGGNTWQRFKYLRNVARRDLGLARLLEGHFDATAILREAGRSADRQATYAIWASGGPVSTTALSSKSAALVIAGTKGFCSGSDIVDRALVLSDDDGSLVEVDIAEVDADSFDRSGEAYPRALAVRHHVERMCHEVMDHFGRLFGPRPLAFDPRIEQHYAELTLYIRQCHAERDLEELGAKVLETKLR